MTAASEVKQKISLKYDKIELENKLAEMMQTINGFKAAYGHNSSKGSNKTHSRAASQDMKASNRAQSEENLNRSNVSHLSSVKSLANQINPRNGRPRALKVLQRSSNQVQASKSSSNLRHPIDPYVASSTPAETSNEPTVELNSDNEQTFRPQALRRKASLARESRNYHDLPLQPKDE